MKAVCLGMMSFLLLCVVPEAPAEGDLPPAAREVLKQYEDEAVEVEKKIEAEVKKRWDKAAVELKKVQDEYCKEAKLDEAVAVRNLIRGLRDGTAPPPPADLPIAAREVYKQYEEEVDEIHKKADAEVKKRWDKVAAELKKVQDLYCKEAKLDEAVAVRDLLRSLRDGGATAVPDPSGYVNNPATDIGKVFFYEVTGLAAGQAIYGSDVYTTGSHLGMAAVHCGVLKDGQKGIVKVTILPGQANYAATTRNGITSYAYGNWGVSFKVERGFGFVGRLPRAEPRP